MRSTGVELSLLAQPTIAAATVAFVEQQAATAAAGPAAAAFLLVLQVRAAYALADFDEPVRLRFRRSFAGLACFCAGGCCLTENHVSLSVQEDPVGGRRAGGGLLVNVTLAGAPSADAAAGVVVNLTDNSINVALHAEGLDAVTVTMPPAVVRSAGVDNNAFGAVFVTVSTVASSALVPVPNTSATSIAFINVPAKSIGRRAQDACCTAKVLQIALFFLLTAVNFSRSENI